MTTARSYGVLKPGVGKVDVCLQNHSTKLITVPKQTAMGEIAAAIAIPALLTPKPNESSEDQKRHGILLWNMSVYLLYMT